MELAQHSVGLRSPPSGAEIEPDLEHLGDATNRVQGHLAEQAALDPRHRGIREASRRRNVALAKTPADPDGPENATDAHVIHVDIVSGVDLRPLIVARRGTAGFGRAGVQAGLRRGRSCQIVVR